MHASYIKAVTENCDSCREEMLNFLTYRKVCLKTVLLYKILSPKMLNVLQFFVIFLYDATTALQKTKRSFQLCFSANGYI
jgi:hypothetical protein